MLRWPINLMELDVYDLCSDDLRKKLEAPRKGLKSELEKASPSLDGNAVYLKDSQINGLPTYMPFLQYSLSGALYLTIQFVRYFWSKESNQNAKILHKVDYPVELDVYDLCSDDLRKKLEPPHKGSSNVSGESSNATSKEGVVPDKEMHLTGIYDLVAMLTHKGRSADLGHYVAWVKQESGIWMKYDDRNPIPQQEEDITKLSRGGDWRMAYMCMYKARLVPM
ncbi:hypothetical protein RHSIM_Rhsim12G0192600 [Rhododendron simsii]|uniref:ubiquitinyl hydrolase 1 n=1 Tax=Rhododendron simsii TaxID=118357 RepID=A0A834G5T0_RHOSS|nr:hypothetical protein RHSIM_Rhsim12G0192600 [Rhododendron simsii]